MLQEQEVVRTCKGKLQVGSTIVQQMVAGSTTRELISRMDLRETNSDNGWWIEVTQDRVKWRAMTLVVLILRDLLPESWLNSKTGLRKTGCDDGKWLVLTQE